MASKVAKVVEISASSPTSVEDAVTAGLKKTAATVKNIQGAWVNEINVRTDADGNVREWRVNMRVTFMVE
ncbi:MAG TPA: dodecin family protein [Xanthomonadaceae bacterium]|nr:dodecin family protein [Xanthomonadaceae bacterium]